MHMIIIYHIFKTLHFTERWKNCSLKPDPKKLRHKHTFRFKHGLLYPVNIARNIARYDTKSQMSK